MSDKDEYVLVVDDDPNVLIIVEKLLEPLKCKIIKTRKASEAIDLVTQHDYAVIILDIKMPEMSGFEIAQKIHNEKKTSLIPIIFLTALSSRQLEIEGYKLGCIDYLFKPINSTILKNKVNVFLDLHSQKRELEMTISELERVNKILNYEVQLRKEAEKKQEKMTNELTKLKSSTDKIKKNGKNQIKFKKMLEDLLEEIKGSTSAKTIKLEIQRLIQKIKNEYNEVDIKTFITELELIPQLKTNNLFRLSKGIKDIIQRL